MLKFLLTAHKKFVLAGLIGRDGISSAVGVNETFDRLIHAHVSDLAYLTQSRGWLTGPTKQS